VNAFFTEPISRHGWTEGSPGASRLARSNPPQIRSSLRVPDDPTGTGQRHPVGVSWPVYMQPESFDVFFDHLNSLGIHSGTVVAYLEALPNSRRQEFLIELYALLPGPSQYPSESRHSPFTFLASSTLSGHSHRRIAAVDSLARFGALYADTIFIREPRLADHTLASSADPTLLSHPTELALDLEVLFCLEPLLKAGIVRLARNFFPLQAAPQTVNEVLQKTLQSAERALYDRFAHDTSTTVL
jgi:hypothetical protein